MLGKLTRKEFHLDTTPIYRIREGVITLLKVLEARANILTHYAKFKLIIA